MKENQCVGEIEKSNLRIPYQGACVGNEGRSRVACSNAMFEGETRQWFKEDKQVS